MKAKPNSGLNILEWLFLIFTTLKIAGVINWSWWLVLMPLWIVLADTVFVAFAREYRWWPFDD